MSFVLWRLIDDKLPSKDFLWKKGVVITSICSHCYNAYETTTHVFFECPFALSLWDWLFKLVDNRLNITNILGILNKPWSKLANFVLLVVVTFIVAEIWNSQNQIKFKKKFLKLIF
uniref:Reverse transcriptase zinc-binding domain-containing protein n=1 Tax=Cajanus cajan TaxID=3821 RepID=A0A151SBF6_CAJCA|nr:hypothetical protein KK1_025902 [Cajanus cajan]